MRKKTGFDRDKRIKFVGTVYDQDLLKKIRECAFAYLHGHEVGGTNPSLLEAMASTKVNLLLDVGFNREVGGDGALYWGKKIGELQKLIDEVSERNIQLKETQCKKRIEKDFSWSQICNKYEKVFDI